jgi:hypothetical protein
MNQDPPTTAEEFGKPLINLTGQALRDIHVEAARGLPPETVLVGIVNSPQRVNDPIDIGGNKLYTSSELIPEGWLATDTLIGLTPGLNGHYVTLSRPWHTEDLDTNRCSIHHSDILPAGTHIHIKKDDLPRLFDENGRQKQEKAQREDARKEDALADELRQSLHPNPEFLKQPPLARIANAPATPGNLALTMMAIVVLIGIVLAIVDSIF